MRQASGFSGIYRWRLPPARAWLTADAKPIPWVDPTEDGLANYGCSLAGVQMLALRAATGNAFTIFLAGLALTMVILPKISLLPALVAGFMRVLMRHRPGTVKMPDFFTSAVAISASSLMALAATDFFSSHLVATASARAPLVMSLPPAFIAFMGAMVEKCCEVAMLRSCPKIA